MRSHLGLGLVLFILGCSSFRSGTTPDAAPADVEDVPDTPTIDTPDAGSVDALDAPSIDSLDVPETAASDVIDVPPDTGPPRCASSSDCSASPDGLACDLATGRCVSCTATDDRCSIGQYCVASMNRCVPGCRDDDACATATGDGGVVLRRCDTAAHQCVECVSNEHCALGNLCMGHRCVPGCTATRACPSGQSCCGGGCVDTQTNTDHCGACGQTCSVANAAAACLAGRCVVGTCAMPFADCDGMAGNGCEADLRTSTAHCASCGRTCTGGTCANGACTCPAGRTLCGGACVDLRTDRDNCGACGYRVVSAGRPGESNQRTCVGGAPSPPWLTLGSQGGPLVAHGVAPVWTGRRFLYVLRDTTVLASATGYNPDRDIWTSLPPPSVPLGSQLLSLIGMPDRRWALAVFDGGRAYLFDDSGSEPSWLGVPGLPITGAPTVLGVYTGDYVFLFDDREAGRGARLNLTSREWTVVPSAVPTGICVAANRQPSGARFAFANGLVLLFAGSSAASDNSDYCGYSDRQHLARLDPAALMWTTDSFERTTTHQYTRTTTTLLGVGARTLVAGGNDFRRCDSGTTILEIGPMTLYDPRARDVLAVPAQPQVVGSAFSAFTGRAAIHFGGAQIRSDCGRYPTTTFANGVVGVVNPRPNGINWQTLPTPPTGFVPRANFDSNDFQGGWTGQEFIVYGGTTAWSGGMVRSDGIRYQPPVGCVCPQNDDAPAWIPHPCRAVDRSTIVTSACLP